ncbi:hypothetical protein T10_2244 [Trichinella papuae]|uniref:Uncharacterized protein n=1 Tax=Trichinella papuae TaxID=268474 RepID=A0A0V1LXG9_9BILA|nr:hypothetical protein T10_2244 [Trichinella papuae]
MIVQPLINPVRFRTQQCQQHKSTLRGSDYQNNATIQN